MPTANITTSVTFYDQCPEPPNRPTEPALYVIKHISSGLVKIGITNNLKRRCRGLKVGTDCAFLTAVKTEQNLEHELQLHQLHSQWRIPGTEWFHLTPHLESQLLAKVATLGEPATGSSILKEGTSSLLAAKLEEIERTKQASARQDREMTESLILSLEPLHKGLADMWTRGHGTDDVTISRNEWNELRENLQRGTAGIAQVFADHTWETI